MNALPAGIIVFILAALATLCPTGLIYAPALLAIVISAGFIGGVTFSLQSDGVYELRIRRGGPTSSQSGIVLGNAWDYGFIGIAAGLVGLVIVARIVGIDVDTISAALAPGDGIGDAARRLATSIGVFGITLICGFLGLNLIKMISQRALKELQEKLKRNVQEELAPDRMAERATKLLENHAYESALEAFRQLGKVEQTLRSAIGEALALRHLSRIPEAIACLDQGLREFGKTDPEGYRRAVAYWNRACYKCLKYKENITPETVNSVIADLKAALDNEAGFRNSLNGPDFDPDLNPIRADPTFKEWLAKTAGG